MDIYVGTKIVKAFKIGAINWFDYESRATLVGGEHSVDVGVNYVTTHKPQVGGYYVQYEDGYESWSPAAPFEKAYKLGTAYTTPSIHPPPTELTEAELQENPILRYFHYAHLPDKLKVVSQPFFELATKIVRELPKNAERTTALRKLLEAKDCAVRTLV